jgi:hypothetical protein
MGTGADTLSGQNQRTISLPTREQHMFRTSSWAIALTGSPFKAHPIQHPFDVLLEES